MVWNLLCPESGKECEVLKPLYFFLDFWLDCVSGVDFFSMMKGEILMMQWTNLSNSKSVLKAGGEEVELPGIRCREHPDAVCMYKPSF